MSGGMLATIGRTPVVRARAARRAGHGRGLGQARIREPDRLLQGPHGARDDRGRRAVGAPAPGQTVVEYTGGSTGSSLAYVCALKGYPLRIVTSDAFAQEKLRTMAAFGADVEIIPSPEGITPDLIPRMMERAKEIVEETGGYRDRPVPERGHGRGLRRARATSSSEQLDGRIDAFCAYVGTAGCFTRRDAPPPSAPLPDLHRVAVEPAESPVALRREPGTHRIEGGGVGLLAALARATTTSTRCERVLDRRRLRDGAARRARGRSLVGPVDGREPPRRARARTASSAPASASSPPLVDSGLKYLAGDLYS